MSELAMYADSGCVTVGAMTHPESFILHVCDSEYTGGIVTITLVDANDNMVDDAIGPVAPFKEILVWKFSQFTRKREHAVAFKSMLRRSGHPRSLHHRARL